MPLSTVGWRLERLVVLSSKLVLNNGAIRQPFFLMAIPTLIVGVLFYFVLKERVIRPEDEGQEIKKKERKISLKQIFQTAISWQPLFYALPAFMQTL